MHRSKLSSLFLLFLLSLIPFSVVMYIWHIRAESYGWLFLILGGLLFFPCAIIFVSTIYYYLVKKYELPQLPLFVIIIVPVVINLISTQWYFIRVAIARTQYFNQYQGMNLDVDLVEGGLIPTTEQVYNFAADYQYKLLLKNPSTKFYNNVELFLTIEYKGTDDTNYDLAQDILKINIHPGDNVLEGKIPIDSYSLRCRYITVQSPVYFSITQQILERKKSIRIPLEGSLTNQLIEINSNLENANEGATYPLRGCE